MIWSLALRHISRGLRRYFEAHPITVITNQPIKQILNKADTSGRLAPDFVELAAYNITYEPHSAIKGHILLDFINEVSVGSKTIVPRQNQYTIDHQKDCKEEWVLYIDGALSAKGSGVGLVLISPTKMEYNIRAEANFDSTNQPSCSGRRGETWMTPIINCLEKGVWPEDQNEARALRMKMSQYVMEEGVIFKRSYLMPMLRCVGPLQANYVIPEIHIRACIMHLKARSVVAKGMDVLGPLPEAPGKVRFVIVAVDYFTKWIEAKPLAKTAGKEINTAVAHPQANDLVERANRSLMEGIKTRLGRERKGWVDELPNVLWAHRTSLKTSNGETPYSLTFGSEAVIPV
ncbi:reverse transcriptase domain-containing protein [Tanacetum coccineum]